MSDALSFRRLRYTPMRDLVRGKVSGRLDLRGRVAAAALPAPVAAVVLGVVRRTRLWRLEKAAVADELIAHFADGLASGTTADELIRDFGDARAAARLIRRAKRRNRPLAWHAIKWARRGLLVLAAVYGIVFVRFVAGEANVSVDYYAILNASTLATPVEDRGWPIYREAIGTLGLADGRGPSPLDERIDPEGSSDRYLTLLEAKPGGPAFDWLAAWVDANPAGIESIRRAADKERLGFVLGRGGSADDPVVGSPYTQRDGNGNPVPPDAPWARRASILDDSLIGVMLPYLARIHYLAHIVVADARVARSRGEGDRLARDFEALRGMAAQLRLSLLIDQLVAVRIDQLLLNECRATLLDAPGLLDEDQLVALAHRLAHIGGEAAATVLNYNGERALFRDVVQRLYTDDGHGDGRLTRDGALALPLLTGTERTRSLEVPRAIAFVGLGSIGDTRRDLLNEYDRLLDAIEAQAARPIRESVGPGAGQDASAVIERRIAEINASPIDAVRLLPLLSLAPAMGDAQETVETLLGERDGVTVGIALELHRRRNEGRYPATLDALVPAMLPRVPADRITGEPIRYALVDGEPVVYSVGVDRDDDGGRAWTSPKTKEPDDAATARWPRRDDAKAPLDGDWILFEARPSTPATTGQ